MGTTAIGALKIPFRHPWVSAAWKCLAAHLSRPSAGSVSVLKTVAIGQKASAVLLAVNDERLLLGVTSQSVTVMRSWRADPATLNVRGEVF